MAIHPTLCFAALVFWSSYVASTAVLPVVGRQHFDVAITTASLTDFDRIDPFANDGRARSVMVSAFNPVAHCQQKHLEPYMPPTTATFQDDKFAAYGLPNGSFQSLLLETCKTATNQVPCSSVSLPLVLFSGALGTSRLLYTSMLQSVAATGYQVISIDHPYDADIVEFSNGTIIKGINISDAELELALNTRSEDVTFVRQQMANATIAAKLFPGHRYRNHLPRTAIIGHSFGGAAAASVMLQDPSISAGFNLDGSMFGKVLDAGLDRPFMLMGHENKTQETDPSWKAIWPQLKGWKREFEIRGAAHYSFSDLPLITSVLGLQPRLSIEIGQVLGTVEGRHMTELIVAYTTAFLNMVFRSSPEGVLSGGNSEFPEVVKVA